MNSRFLDRLRRALLVVGTLLIGYTLWAMIDARVFQSGLARRLEALARGPSAHALREAVATREEARTSGTIGRIDIPRLRISAPVLESTSGRALRRGVGHVRHTAFPGERGNAALAAHRDTYFRGLRGVAKGDWIRVATPDGVFAYRVDSILVVRPDREDLLGPTREPRLTLVTCYPFRWIGPAPKRFIVQARLVDVDHASNRRPPGTARLAAFHATTLFGRPSGLQSGGSPEGLPDGSRAARGARHVPSRPDRGRDASVPWAHVDSSPDRPLRNPPVAPHDAVE
jgi:sortase A